MLNILCYCLPHACIQWWTQCIQCMQAQRTNPMGHRGSIQGQMYVQRTNSMGLWRHNACTKEQSYRDMRYLCVQRTNPMGIGCTNRGPILLAHDARTVVQSYGTLHVRSYIYLCTCESSMPGTKNHLYGKPSLHKEELL